MAAKTMAGVIRSIEKRRDEAIADDTVVRIAEIPASSPSNGSYWMALVRCDYRESERVKWEILYADPRKRNRTLHQGGVDAMTADERDDAEARAFEWWRRELGDAERRYYERLADHKAWELRMESRRNEDRARSAAARIRGEA